MAFIEKTAKPEKLPVEPAKHSKTNPLVFGGTVLVLIIVIVAFVLVPAIVPEAGTGLDTTFGYYGKAPVTYAAKNYFYQARESYAREYGNIAGFERYLWRRAFEETVFRTAVIEEARLSGYVPPDTLVDKAVAQLPDFQENGRFSVVRYRALSGAERIRIWEEMREGLAISRYFSDVSTILVADSEKKFVANMADKRRSFDVAAFSINDYPAEEISAYIDSRKDLFQTVRLSQITISSSERDARKALEQVKAGVSAFEDAARSQSADSNADRGGDMGTKMAFELVSEIPDEAARTTVLALEQGAVSDVVKTPGGWAFFRVEESAREPDSADTATIDKARSYMLDFERGIIEDYYIAKAEAFNAAVEEVGFDNACFDAGLTKSTIGPLPVNYGDNRVFATVTSYAVKALEGAAVNENFWKTAFTATIGVPSRPIVLGNNVTVLFPLEEVALDDDTRASIENYYASIVNDTNLTYSGLSEIFLKSKKFKDRFDTVFAKLYPEE